MMRPVSAGVTVTAGFLACTALIAGCGGATHSTQPTKTTAIAATSVTSASATGTPSSDTAAKRSAKSAGGVAETTGPGNVRTPIRSRGRSSPPTGATSRRERVHHALTAPTIRRPHPTGGRTTASATHTTASAIHTTASAVHTTASANHTTASSPAVAPSNRPQKTAVKPVAPEKAHPSTQVNEGTRGPGTAASGTNPCTYISPSEAASALHAASVNESEAPLGPTCLLTTSGRTRRSTLAVEVLALSRMLHEMKGVSQTQVSGHTAYCGTIGQQILLLRLNRYYVLDVAAPCTEAKALAGAALPRIRL